MRNRNIRCYFNTMNILIIEDCRIMTFLWKLQAKEAGHITTCCEYKHEALELLRNNNYDLIILDNNLNGELGLEIAREIKDITKTKIIFVLVLLSYMLVGVTDKKVVIKEEKSILIKI